MPSKAGKKKTSRRVRVKMPDYSEEIKKTEMEKSALEEKNKHLLQIIEEISKPSPEESKPKEKEIEVEKTKSVKTEDRNIDEIPDEEERTEKSSEEKKDKPLIGLKEFGEKIETRVKEKFDDNRERRNLKKDIGKMVKDDIDTRFSKLSEDLKKVADIEKKLNEFTNKASIAQSIPIPQAVPPEAYQSGASQSAGLVSKGMAAFGEEMDLQSELLEIKKSIKEVGKNLDNLRKKTDYNITTISDKIKLLDKIPTLEENFQTVSEKLGPDNVQKMRKLIFSADELVDEVIPDLVGKKMRVKMGPAINEIRNIKHSMDGVRKSMDHMNLEILNLKKAKDDIKALELEKDRLYKEIIGRDAKFREGVDILKTNIKKKLETMTTDINDRLEHLHDTNHQKIEKDINKIFTDVVQLKMSEMDKNYSDLNERIKKLTMFDDKLSKHLDELKAPENVKKWVGNQLKNVYDDTIPEIKSIKNDILKYLEQIKSLREGIKNLDSFSIDISKTSETHKESIDMLVAEKKNIFSMIERLKSEIRILDEKFLMEKQRLSELGADVKAREITFRSDLDNQKTHMTDFRLEVTKMIENSMRLLKDELEQERSDDIKNQTNELKSDIMRIDNLKTELDKYKKSQEIKLDRMVSDLKNLPPDIKVLSGRIGSLETLVRGLGKEKINESEFSSIVKLITKRIGEIEDHFDEIEENVSKDSSRIEKVVNDLLSDDRIIKSTQNLVEKDISGKIQDLSKSLSSKVSSVSEKLKENSDTISYLKEKYNVLDSLTNGVPKKLESQTILINKIMNSGDSIAKKADFLAAELKSLSGKIVVNKDRIMAVEQKMNIQDKEKDSRINKLAGDITKTNEDMESEIASINAKMEEIGALGKTLNEKSISESEFISTVKSISKRIDDIEGFYTKLDKESSMSKTKLQAAMNHALSDDKVLKSTQESLGRLMKDSVESLDKKMYSEFKNLSSQLEEKSGALSKGIYSDMEKLTGQVSENYESMVNMRERLSSLMPAVKQLEEHDDRISKLKEKIQILNSLVKDFPKKFDQHTNELKNMIGSSGFLSKRTESLDAGLKSLIERLNAEIEKTTALDKEFKSHSNAGERRLDSIDNTISRISGNAQASSLEIGVLKERLDNMEKRFEQSLKKSNEEKHSLREDIKKQSERVGRIIKELSE
jgi:chromosome segregation ATPase